MKRIAWIGAAATCTLALWMIAQVQSPPTSPAALMPNGALLYLEAQDFHSLIHDWNASQAKRTWLAGDDYAGFSRSRLFQRLSQAQDEFSATATIPADANLLGSVAGSESALALYDIGNLQFVYVTRMEEAKAAATPLWLARDKFEQRAEGAARFYLREDQQSNRTAAFALDKGWLILGTRADLVAGVLDRIEGTETRGLREESWYADAVKQASAPPGDLRMVLNLESIVPSPYFRSYWVQRNITELKQYRAAICDLHRTDEEYRENRVLLRAPEATARSSGDVTPLMALAPDDAVFASAQASPSPEQVLLEMREYVLDPRPHQVKTETTAPSATAIENAGKASDLEQRIDLAPVGTKESDPYAVLRGLVTSASPNAVLAVYRTLSSTRQMFVGIERGMVVQAASPWSEAEVRDAVSATFRRDVTTSQLGIGWGSRVGAEVNMMAMDGSIPLYLAVRGNRLYMSSSDSLLSAMLNRDSSPAAAGNEPVTYEARFQHSAREQQVFSKLAGCLDAAGHGAADSGVVADENPSEGQAPAFLSGNIASLSRMWSNMRRETVTEKDQGATVAQTVVYEWSPK